MLAEFLKFGVFIICERFETSLHILRFVLKNMTVFNTVLEYHQFFFQYLLWSFTDWYRFFNAWRNVFEDVIVIQRFLRITVVGPFKMVCTYKIRHLDFSSRDKVAIRIISASCCGQGLWTGAEVESEAYRQSDFQMWSTQWQYVWPPYRLLPPATRFVCSYSPVAFMEGGKCWWHRCS